MNRLLRISLTVPPAAADRFAALLEPFCPAVSTLEISEGVAWSVEGIATEAPPRDEIALRVALMAAALALPEPEVRFEPIPDTDWLSQVHENFPPLSAGRIHIRGSHERRPPPPGSARLVIDAATAFGSGQHESTFGCLLALDGFARRGWRPRRVLDMGCGSGILGLAAARLWRRPVLACDIDPEAVRVTRGNARLNRLHPWVTVHLTQGYVHPAIRSHRPVDLALANILARPLAHMAGDLARALAPGGTAVLAGLLRRQERFVLAAHRPHRLRLVGRRHLGAWSILTLRAPQR